jgi:hypothetical protein
LVIDDSAIPASSRHLVGVAKDLYARGLARGTQSNYKTARASLANFLHEELQWEANRIVLPVPIDAIIAWVAHLTNKKMRASTIAGYVSSLSILYKTRQLTPPGQDHQIVLMLNGLKRLQFEEGQGNTVRSWAVTSERLELMCNALAKLPPRLASTGPDDIHMLRAAYHVAHFCCLRVGEIAPKESWRFIYFYKLIRTPTYVTSRSRGTTAPRTGEWSLEIKLPMSKTDKYGQGSTRLQALHQPVLAACPPH